MPKVKGKEQLCICEQYETYFKSVQGLGRHTLFERYSDIENIVNRRIDEKYRHFLAQPVVEGDTIYWFSKPYGEIPQRLSDLQDGEHAKYEQIKNNTLAHYEDAIGLLKSEGKTTEAECLEKAITFANNDFVYCFDGKTVLGIWGMQLREHVNEPLGIAMKNASFKEKRKPFTVRFNAGENGRLTGISEYGKYAGETVKPSEAPTVVPKKGYEFTGWDKNPNGYRVAGDVEFTAQYREIAPPAVPESPFTVRFNAGENGVLNGISKYGKRAGETVKPSEVPTVAPKKGYEFTGWDKNPNDHRVTGDIEFTAQYGEISLPESPFKVRFNAGENGVLNGISEYRKRSGETVKPSEVPTVAPKEGYEFTGWDKNPNNYTVTDDVEFRAQYREIPFTVRFNAGRNGVLNGISEYRKRAGETVKPSEVPTVVPRRGYEFTGWDKNPNNYTVTDDVEFTAQYREIPPNGHKVPERDKDPNDNGVTDNTGNPPIDTDHESGDKSGDESRWSRFGFAGGGCLNWLLLLLLLALIFMVIWCCLLKQCNFNFCGCDCEKVDVVVPGPKSANHTVRPNIKPVVSPCNAQVRSGGYEGYVGVFEMGRTSGSFVFQYNTNTIPDKITVYDGADTGGKIIFTYKGSTGASKSAVVPFSQPAITVEIIGQATGTVWDFKVNCPQ
jgi:hypothetical protein